MDGAGQKSPSGSILDKELSPRGIGILALCFFPLMLYMAVIRPLSAIAAGETPDPPGLMAFVMTFITPLLGIAYTLFPGKAEKTLGSWRVKATPLGLCIWIVVVALSFGAYTAMKSHVKPYREQATENPSPTEKNEVTGRR